MGGRYKLVFWGALFIAALATFGAYRLLDARSNAAKETSQTVVVATRDIPEGALIDRVALGTVVWPSRTVPAGAFASIDSVAGRVARVNVFTGEALVPGRLAPSGTGPGLELKIPAGQRAMAVRINDVAGISGLIQPNSRVDVLVTIASADGSRQVAKLFMENMRVLSVGTEIQRGKDGQANSATTVTLGVTPEEAERLAIAMNTGAIQLVLRGYGDPDSVRTAGATSLDVLRQLQGSRVAAPAATEPVKSSRPAPRRVVATKPVQPPPTPVIVTPPKPETVDSVVVNVYRAGKATPLKFDTATKR
jgi:pilus assembly protein CpaB